MDSSSVLPHAPDLRYLAQIIQLAIAPVFLLAGLGAFLNVCAGRLARIVDRIRVLEPRILASRGEEHDRLIEEVGPRTRQLQGSPRAEHPLPRMLSLRNWLESPGCAWES